MWFIQDSTNDADTYDNFGGEDIDDNNELLFTVCKSCSWQTMLLLGNYILFAKEYRNTSY